MSNKPIKRALTMTKERSWPLPYAERTSKLRPARAYRRQPCWQCARHSLVARLSWA